MTIITDPLFYLLAVPAVVVLGLSKGGFAGVGQMALPLLALVMPPLEAAAIIMPIIIVQDVAALWVYRRDWNGRILAIMTPGAVIGIAVAGVVAAYVSDAAVRIFIGVTTIAFVLYNWIGPTRVAREAGSASVVGGVLWGAASGFTSTISQAGSPPYLMYVLSQKMTKMAFVSTTAYFFAIMNWFKVIPYAALGQFTATGFRTSLALLPLAILTNLLGFWVVRITPQELFYKIMYAILFLISFALLYTGVSDLLRG